MDFGKFFVFLYLLTSLEVVSAETRSTWIYGTLEEVSFVKNNLNEVETLFYINIKKYSGLNPSEVINYMKFRTYTKGGTWDKVSYPSRTSMTKSLGESSLIYLRKKGGKFYIEKSFTRPSQEKIDLLAGVKTIESYQLGQLAVKSKNKRKPAQISRQELMVFEEFGFFTFCLFLIIFGVSLYFVSRKNNYD
jgi:hypothetical protein